MTTVFEVGSELGGLDTKSESWVGVKKWIGRQSKNKGEA
jgi:dynein intermediate chain